jgi:hypothetical protein
VIVLFFIGITKLNPDSLAYVAEVCMCYRISDFQQSAWETLTKFFLNDMCADDDWNFLQSKHLLCSSNNAAHKAKLVARQTSSSFLITLDDFISEGTRIVRVSAQNLLNQNLNAIEKVNGRCCYDNGEGDYCDKDAIVSTEIFKYPSSVLVIGLQRWYFKEVSPARAAIPYKIPISIELDLEVEVVSDSFELIGAIYHQGRHRREKYINLITIISYL